MTVVNHDFMDLRTRAELLDLCNDPEGAARLRKLSMEIAREVDLTCYGYQLLWRNRMTDAVEILEENVRRHPQSWNAWHTLGDAWVEQGETSRAAECYGQAARLCGDDEQRLRIDTSLQQLIALGAIAS